MKKKQAIFSMIQVTATDKKTIKRIFFLLRNLRNDYPNFVQWFNTKVKRGLIDGSRQIWIAVSEDSQIAGILILKYSELEKKICTLYVFKPYRHQGVGTLMMETAVFQLGIDHPLATVSSNQLPEYKKLLDRFGFQLTKTYKDYYKHGISEYAFNGELMEPMYKIVVNE